MSHYLPNKIPNYLIRLVVQYERVGKALESDIIKNARIYVDEGADYDNWNGGVYGHDVILFLPMSDLGRVDINKQTEFCDGIRDDLRKLCQSTESEYIHIVRLEADDDSDPQYQKAIPFLRKPPPNPDNLSIWKPGLVRLFISHRDIHKSEGNILADYLEEYGISCFVAHDTIEPMSRWREEVIKGLETMEVFLAFVTDDFDESSWTNQEVGFALGKGIPIISIKLGIKDPPAFISHEQALRCDINKIGQSAAKIYELIGKALGNTERLNAALIDAFNSSPSYTDASRRFKRLSTTVKKITDEQLKSIIAAFASNDQLYNCYTLAGKNRLEHYLEEATGRSVVVQGKLIEANFD